MAGRNTVEIIIAARDQASRTISSAFGGIQNISRLAMGAVASATAAAGAAMVTLSALVGKTGIDYNAMQEQSQVAWTTLLGSQEKAKKQLEDIANFAKSTQFDTTTVDAMAKYMNNAGYAGDNLFKQLTKIADVSGAFNIPAESAQELARQMSQVQQAGVAYTEDLNILADRGVPIFQALAKVTGTNVAEVKKMASEGKITADVYNKAFDSIAKSVAGSSEAQSKTYSGMISTLQDNLTIISGLLTQELFEKLKGIMEKVMPIIEKFSSTLKDEGLKEAIKSILPESVLTTITNIVNGFKSFQEAVGQVITQAMPLIDAFKGSFVSLGNSLTPLWESLKTLFNSLLPILQPLAVFIGGTLVVAFGVVISVLNAVIAAIGPLITAFVNFLDVVVNVVKSVVSLIMGDYSGAMNYWNQATKSSVDFFVNLWNGVKAFFGTFVSTIIGYLESWGVDTKSIVEDAKTATVKKFSELKDKAISYFGDIKDKAASKFREVKSAITDPIKEAKDKVGEFIGNIKSFFTNLVLKIPKPSLPKLPHFSLTTSSKTILGKTITYPTGFGVDWYDKGGVFYGPQVIGVGEKRPEFVGALDDLRKIVREETQTNQVVVPKGNVEIPLIIDGYELTRLIIPFIDLIQGKNFNSELRLNGVK